MTGLIFEVSDMDIFRKALGSDKMRKAMEEDGLKVETLRMLTEFTP